MLLLDFFAECHHQSHLDFRLQIFCRSAFCNTKRGRNGHNEPKIGVRQGGHPRSEEVGDVGVAQVQNGAHSENFEEVLRRETVQLVSIVLMYLPMKL